LKITRVSAFNLNVKLLVLFGVKLDRKEENLIVYVPKLQNWFTNSLCKIFPYKEIGWKEIGEVFYRWTLFECRWFKVVLHKLDAPNWHTHCHDHPWDFLAIILAGGYWEKIDPKQDRRNHGKRVSEDTYWRSPGSILYRPAESRHNVATPKGAPNWSVVFMTPKKRDWGIKDCRNEMDFYSNIVTISQ
jgi:hypothetical protein